jgi:aarF domain-containing kinase
VVDADLALLTPVVRFLARQGVEQVAALHSFLGGLGQQVAEELDLRNEAEAMARFRALFAELGLDRIVIPEVDPTRSGRRVLTMELLDGVAIDTPEAVDWAGADPRPLLLQLLKGWFTTAVTDGVFHGDLHAGNLLLLRDGRLGLIDWGILGRLDPATHWLFRRLLEACLGDVDGWRDVAQVYRVMGLSLQDELGMSDAAAGAVARAQLEPLLTRPFARIDLGGLFLTSREATAAMREGAGGRERSRDRLARWRAARRHGRRVVAAGLREKPFDRANFMLGKQLLYVERFGKLYLPDVALLEDRRYARRLLARPGPPSPLEGAEATAAGARPPPAGPAFTGPAFTGPAFTRPSGGG